MSFPFYFQFVSLHISGPLRLNTWGLLQLLTHLLADLLTESHNNDLRSKRTHKNCSIPHVCIPPPPQRWGGGGGSGGTLSHPTLLSVISLVNWVQLLKRTGLHVVWRMPMTSRLLLSWCISASRWTRPKPASVASLVVWCPASFNGAIAAYKRLCAESGVGTRISCLTHSSLCFC